MSRRSRSRGRDSALEASDKLKVLLNSEFAAQPPYAAGEVHKFGQYLMTVLHWLLCGTSEWAIQDWLDDFDVFDIERVKGTLKFSGVALVNGYEPEACQVVVEQVGEDVEYQFFFGDSRGPVRRNARAIRRAESIPWSFRFRVRASDLAPING